MNTVNQTFDWSRFTAALRKEIVENSRTIMFSVVGVYALLAITMILGNLFMGLSGSESPVMDMGEKGMFPIPYMIVGYILSFACSIVASLSFKKLTKKTGRIDMFTSPSSTLEKFLVNITIYVLGFIVAFFICAQLADLTRIAVLWFFHDRIAVPGPINFLNTFSEFAKLGDGSMYGFSMSKFFPLAILSTSGLFFMGSVLWPRLSFLKTFAAIYAIEIIASICFIITFACMGTEEVMNFFSWITKTFNEGNLLSWYAAFIIGQLLLFWGLAWYLFKRKDVISLKWWK